MRIEKAAKGLIDEIIEAYRRARKPIHNYKNKVIRGRSRAISSEAEEIVAAFLAAQLDGNYRYYIDQAISIKGKTYYPDIMIIDSDNQILHLIDAKMDLGWNRKGLPDFCKKKSNMINKIRGMEGTFKEKSSKKSKTDGGKSGLYTVSKKCSFHIVIISGKNITENLLMDQIKNTKRYRPWVYAYLLSNDVHPNEYWAKNIVKQEIKTDVNQFIFLLKNLRR